MHYLYPLVVWAVSFGAAYSVGRSWVEAKHANGLPWLSAWLIAALTSVGFTSAYFLLIVAGLETAQSDGVTPEMTTGLWDAWIIWVVAPVLALGGISFLGSWARTYRDMVSQSSVSFPTYAALNEKYGSVTSTPQAARAVTRDLTRRTRRKLFGGQSTDTYLYDPSPVLSNPEGFRLPDIKLPKLDFGSSDSGDGDGGAEGTLIVVAVVAVIIAVCLGVITTWVVISRIAGQSEPLPYPARANA